MKESSGALVIAFNRPHLAALVFEALAERSDIPVYVCIDGPREGRKHDISAIAEISESARDILKTQLKEVATSRVNVGCAANVVRGVSWMLSRVPEGIVLEDDCVPTQEFLDFARWGLWQFERVPQVRLITGTNPVPSQFQRGGGQTPYLSAFPQMWGWATWREKWHPESFTSWRVASIKSALLNSSVWNSMGVLERRDWQRMFQKYVDETLGIWDYPFVLDMWSRNEVCLAPASSLVANVGFGSDATHTEHLPTWYSAPQDGPSWLDHADCWNRESILDPGVDARADAWLRSNVYSPPLSQRLRRRFAKFKEHGA